MKLFCILLVLITGIIAFSLPANAGEVGIHNGSKVAFDYVLMVEGKVVDSSQGRGPLAYVQGEGKLLPALTKQLEGMKAGEEKTVELKPEDAYGNQNPAGIREIPLSSVPKDIKPEVGMVLRMQDDKGQAFPARITEIKKESIVIDLNHPLAGKTLIFKIKISTIN